MTYYPDAEDAARAHATLIAKFGGTLGIRDRGALEAALARPQIGYYNDLIEEAAALWESLSQNHPFLDGNKRVAVTLTAAFLRASGFQLRFNDLEAYEFLLGLYESRQFQAKKLDQWLRERTVPPATKLM